MFRSIAFVFLLSACNNSSESGNQSPTPESAEQAGVGVVDLDPASTLTEDVNAAQLEQMSVSALQQLYTQRKSQDINDKEELQLKQALASAMCQQYKQILDTCVSLTPLVVSQYNQSIDCQGGVTSQVAAPQTIQVTVPGTASGQFILVTNNQTNMTPFQSDPFGSGTTTIVFRQKVGRAITPPTFGELSSLYLASATDNGKLPPITNFNNFLLQINGKTLIQGNLLPYPDSDYQTTRYNVPLDAVTQMRRSASCSMSQDDVAALTKQIAGEVVSQQAIDREKAYQKKSHADVATGVLPADKPTLISTILQYQESLITREPVLEKTRDTVLKLTNALTLNQDVGCHYNDIITSIKVRINGAQDVEESYVGNFSDPATNPRGTGGCNDFLIDLGSVKQTFNQSNQSIYQENSLDFAPNSATIGSLSYIRLKKARVCYHSMKQFHTSYIVISSTDYNVTEYNIFNINSVEVTVNGTLIYQNTNLGLTFRGPATYGRGNPFLEWSSSLQNNNPLWTAFMNKQDCNKTK